MNSPLRMNDYDMLSALLDGQLNESERVKLLKRLDSSPELKSALEELRRTKAMLRSATRRRAPRNFTLKAEMVPARRGGWFSLAPTFGFASAAAVIVLIFTFAIQFLPGLNPTTQMAAPAADYAKPAAAMPTASAARESGAATQSPTGAPMIFWGSPATGMGGGGSEVPPGMGGGPPAGIAPSTPTALPPLDKSQTAPKQPNITPSPVPTLQGAGPILGIQPTEKNALPSATAVPRTPAPVAPPNPAPQPPASQPGIDLRGVQLGLLLVALGAGIAFLMLRRKS